jgi:GNAT superfamily N-acetyltransferase
MTPCEIRPLSPAVLPDLLTFFEGPAFADNPGWRRCYCQFTYVDHDRVDWATCTAEQNRAAACARTMAGTMQGYLAYRDGDVVGWCNAAPRTLLGAFAGEPDPDAAQLGQITCFVVARPHRRTGVARALLDVACEGLRAQGMRIAEASPKAEASSDAEQHYGPLRLFTAAGFSFHRHGDYGCVVVRKRLA